MQRESGPVVAIIVAAGAGERMGGMQKAFAPLLGRMMIAYSLQAMEDTDDVVHIVAVVAGDGVGAAEDLISSMNLRKGSAVCAGGATRRDSVLAGLRASPPSELIIVHDGARPCITPDLVVRGIAAARATGAAIPAVPVNDTIKEVGPGGLIIRTSERSRLYAAQTPQVFATELLKKAHAEASADLLLDDASLFESLGWPVHVFEGDPSNLKVTRPIDIALAETVLRERGVRRPDDAGEMD